LSRPNEDFCEIKVADGCLKRARLGLSPGKEWVTFYSTNRWGAMEREPSVDHLRNLLQSLDIADNEHPDVSLTHETGWALSAFSSGLVLFENIEGENKSARHMKNVPRDKVLRLWIMLAQGELAAVEAEPWLRGYG
jgi:hypothetical protein